MTTPSPPPTTSAPPAAGWWWVLAGLAGILLVATATTLDTDGLLEVGAEPWRALVTLPGHALLLWAWWKLGPRWRRPRLTAALWSLPMLLVPPMHSRDAYSYAAQGWLLRHGHDPYTVPSGDADLPGLLVGVHWFETTSVYPPLSLKVFEWVTRLTDSDLYWTAIAMRVPNVLALVAMAVLLPMLARRARIPSSTVLWAGLSNPLILVQWVGGIHNDAVMVALIAWAFLAAHDAAWRGWRGMLLGGALIGIAMSVKQSAALAGLGVVALAWSAAAPHLPLHLRTWWGLARRAVAAGVVAIAAFAVIAWVTGLGLGWRNPTAGSPLEATSNTPISWVASFARFHELLPEETIVTVLTGVSFGLVLAAVVVLVLRAGPRPPTSAGRPWLVASGSLLAFAVLGPALQPWYLTWVVPFVALARPRLLWQHAWLLAVVLAGVIPALQDVMAPYAAMALLAFPGWLLWRRLRRDATPVLERSATTV